MSEQPIFWGKTLRQLDDTELQVALKTVNHAVDLAMSSCDVLDRAAVKLAFDADRLAVEAEIARRVTP